MFNILLMIILVIIIFIFIILLFGIRLTFEWTKIDNDYDGCIKILIFKRLKIYSFDFESDEEDIDDENDSKNLLELAKPCFDDFKIFLKQLINAITINKFRNHLVIGFSDFSKTGEYIGYIWAVNAILNSSIPNTNLTASPSFKGEVINLKGFLNIDINLIRLIQPLIRLLMKKEVQTFIKGVING